jgi:hypothetical protein
VAEPKLDVQGLLKTWERLGPLTAAPEPSDALLLEVHDFVFRLAAGLPEIARVHQQHDDAMRAALFVSQQGYALSVELKDGAQHDSDKLAQGFIAMARKLGWKPPRECD